MTTQLHLDTGPDADTVYQVYHTSLVVVIRCDLCFSYVSVVIYVGSLGASPFFTKSVNINDVRVFYGISDTAYQENILFIMFD